MENNLITFQKLKHEIHNSHSITVVGRSSSVGLLVAHMDELTKRNAFSLRAFQQIQSNWNLKRIFFFFPLTSRTRDVKIKYICSLSLITSSCEGVVWSSGSVLTTITPPLPPRVVVDLVYWRDVKTTGVVFGASLLLLLSLMACSIVSVISYIGLALLSVTISFRIYRGILQAIQKSDEGHPFKWVLWSTQTSTQQIGLNRSTRGLNHPYAANQKEGRSFLLCLLGSTWTKRWRCLRRWSTSTATWFWPNSTRSLQKSGACSWWRTWWTPSRWAAYVENVWTLRWTLIGAWWDV